MKTLFALLLCFVVSGIVGQNKEKSTRKITRAELLKASVVNDIIDVPDGCRVSSYDFIFTAKKVVTEVNVMGDSITPKIARCFDKYDKGSKIYFTLRMRCPGANTITYGISPID